MSADRKRRRWFRVSLRALMLGVLAVAVFLSYEVNKASRQRAAADAVRRHGGSVHYEHEFVNGGLDPGREPPGPRWLRRALGDEFFQTIRQAGFGYDNSTLKRLTNEDETPCDDALALLATQPGLKELHLEGRQATDKGLMYVGRMAALEGLWVWRAAAVTDAGVDHLAGLGNLKEVHFNCSNLTDRSLVLLSNLPGMETLSLQQNHFTDAGLAGLRRKEKLKRLVIGLGDCRVTDVGLAHLKGCQNLEILDLQGSRVSLGGVVEAVRSLPRLTMLMLAGTGIGEDAKAELLELNPGLWLDLMQLPAADGAGSSGGVH
jgi:hypothetical protein